MQAGNLATVDQLVKKSFEKTQNLYVGHFYAPSAIDPISHQFKLRTKLDMDFGHVKNLSLPVTSQADTIIEDADIEMEPASPPKSVPITPESAVGKTKNQTDSQALALSSNTNQALSIPSHRRSPVWHAPWEIMRVSDKKTKRQATKLLNFYWII